MQKKYKKMMCGSNGGDSSFTYTTAGSVFKGFFELSYRQVNPFDEEFFLNGWFNDDLKYVAEKQLQRNEREID